MSVSLAVSEIFSIKEWRDLETWRGVVQDHWKWRRSIDHIRLFIGPPLYIYIALSGTVFELLDVEKCRNLEIWVKGHSRSFKMYRSKAWVRIPVRQGFIQAPFGGESSPPNLATSPPRIFGQL